MNDRTGDSPESRTGSDLPPNSIISEPDLALIDALQSAPRASWSDIGRAINVDGTTAARRWARLRADGSAWLTAYASARLATVAWVEIGCRPRFIDAVGAATAALPWVVGIEETAGDFDLLVSAGAPDLPTLGRWVRDGIGGLPGIRSTRMRVGITLFGEGSDWRLQALPSARRANLSTPRATSRTGYGARGLGRLSPVDQALITALHADARMSYSALGAASGVSEHTARRRIDQLLRAGDVAIRCDFSYQLAGLPTVVVYGMQVPHAQLTETGSALARLKQVRLCSAVGGRHGLMVHVLLHGLSGIGPFEEMLAEMFPTLEILDRTVVLHTRKRMGWLLDERGRAVGRVPLGPLRS